MTEPAEELHLTMADMMMREDTDRFELIDGVPWMMASPGPEHQGALAELMVQIGTYLRGRNCIVRSAPMAVCLFSRAGDSEDSVDLYVEPDLFILCDRSKLDRKGVCGAPDAVMEILSPSTGIRDFTIKYDLYEKAGVREYWIVNPEDGTVRIFLLENGRFVLAERHTKKDKARVHVLDNCVVDLETVFSEAERWI